MDTKKFTYDLFGTALAIDYEEQGDAWLEYLQASLGSVYSTLTGYGAGFEQASAEFIYPHWRYTPTIEPNQGIQLNIVPLMENGERQIYVFLLSTAELSDSERENWKIAINQASNRLNDDNPEFSWAAVLTQNQGFGNFQALRKTVEVSGVSLRGAKKSLRINMKSPIASLYGSQFAMTWPIIIEGVSNGYNWWAASKDAAKETHDIAALVSLAFGSTWEIAHSPQMMEPGIMTLPSPGPDEPKWGKVQKELKSFPKWAIQSKAKLSSQPELMQALNAFYQGLLMEREHPSYAYVAFVGVLESIGKMTIGEKCNCCGRKYGNKDLYRAGIKSVISQQREVSALVDGYAIRSSTAHEGTLHGYENDGGNMMAANIFAPQQASVSFVYSDLRKVKDAANKALVKKFRVLTR